MNPPAEVIRKELALGERVLWSGQPRQGIYLRGMDVLAIPFSLLWGGIAFFWEYSVINSHAPFFFCLVGVPFVCIGLYMILGRFFFESRQRAATFYAVTDQRVLIVSGTSSRTIKSLNLRTLTDLSLMETKNNQGSIYFGNMPAFSFMARRYGSWLGGGLDPVPCFDCIQNARTVYEIIRKAQQSSK